MFIRELLNRKKVMKDKKEVMKALEDAKSLREELTQNIALLEEDIRTYTSRIELFRQKGKETTEQLKREGYAYKIQICTNNINSAKDTLRSEREKLVTVEALITQLSSAINSVNVDISHVLSTVKSGMTQIRAQHELVHREYAKLQNLLNYESESTSHDESIESILQDLNGNYEPTDIPEDNMQPQEDTPIKYQNEPKKARFE